MDTALRYLPVIVSIATILAIISGFFIWLIKFGMKTEALNQALVKSMEQILNLNQNLKDLSDKLYLYVLKDEYKSEVRAINSRIERVEKDMDRIKDNMIARGDK